MRFTKKRTVRNCTTPNAVDGTTTPTDYYGMMENIICSTSTTPLSVNGKICIGGMP